MPVLIFEEETFLEDRIDQKVKTKFTMLKDEAKADVYNFIKQTRRKNTFIDKHPLVK